LDDTKEVRVIGALEAEAPKGGDERDALHRRCGEYPEVLHDVRSEPGTGYLIDKFNNASAIINLTNQTRVGQKWRNNFSF
jgi:hypothetical protein